MFFTAALLNHILLWRVNLLQKPLIKQLKLLGPFNLGQLDGHLGLDLVQMLSLLGVSMVLLVDA